MGLKESVRDWFIRRELNNQSKEGTVIGKVWNWLNGKKTLIGGIITLVAYVAGGVPLIAGVCSSEACLVTVAKAVGISTMIVGGLHKVYKFIYREEHQ